jgi:hypothetical protein
MGKQTFDRIKKILGILLLVFFVASITAASASATSSDNSELGSGHCDQGHCDYKHGQNTVTTDTGMGASTLIRGMGTADTASTL